MSIVKRNNYLPDQDLTNLSINVDDVRLSDDLTEITVNFGTTPATITVKQGSYIEVNGNSYVIDTADEVFQMSSATDHYITFTDNPSTAFGNSSAIGTFDAQKQGFYQAGNVIRTLKWYIDQTAQEVYVDHNILTLMGNKTKIDDILNTNLETTNILANDIETNTLDINTQVTIINTTINDLRLVSQSGTSSATIAYPSGYTFANTKILLCQILDSGGSNRYCLGKNVTTTAHVSCSFTSSNIVVRWTGTTATATAELVLMRV